MYTPKTSVDRPGPPPVTVQTRSKARKASKVRTMLITSRTGAMNGTVTCQKTANSRAPSIQAASYGARGAVWSAAKTTRTNSGVHDQTSEMYMTKNAVQRSLIHARPVKPAASSTTLTSPNWSLKSHLNMNPEITGETVRGRIRSVRTSASPGKCLLTATATPTPRTTSVATVSPVKSSVFGITTVVKMESVMTAR